MTAELLGAVDSSLASQCLAFCQALASQGKDFSFSLTVNSTFSFSLDTRESKVKPTVVKKRSSPSTQRRNARRREEFFRKKLNFSSASSSASDMPADHSPDAKTGEAAAVNSSSAAALSLAPEVAPLPSSPSGPCSSPPALRSACPSPSRLSSPPPAGRWPKGHCGDPCFLRCKCGDRNCQCGCARHGQT